ncbi:MAG: hypothetical protein V3T58_06715 [Candidatus Hydrothermarchaeales archaeon]
MKFVLNASPLIHIVRAGYSNIFEKLGDLAIPREVYNVVVVHGKEKGAPDSYVIEKLIENGTIVIADVEDKDFLDLVKSAASNELKPLHEGESEVLALAKEKNATAIVDEYTARKISRILNIPARGSVYLFIVLYKKKMISKKEVIDAFESMVKTGWRISPKDYSVIKEELEKL